MMPGPIHSSLFYCDIVWNFLTGVLGIRLFDTGQNPPFLLILTVCENTWRVSLELVWFTPGGKPFLSWPCELFQPVRFEFVWLILSQNPSFSFRFKLSMKFFNWWDWNLFGSRLVRIFLFYWFWNGVKFLTGVLGIRLIDTWSESSLSCRCWPCFKFFDRWAWNLFDLYPGKILHLFSTLTMCDILYG